MGGGGERRGRRLVGGAALGGGQARPHSTWFSACLPGLGGLNPVCGWDGGGMGGAPVCPGLGVCTRWVGGKKKGVGGGEAGTSIA